MLDLKELIKLPEYKWLEEYKDRLCFITLGGSHAYGTNIESSDIDIRGVMLPTKEELIGLKSFEQRIDEDTDTVIYSFNKFIRLIMDCNPNTIELLGCREYLIFNEVGKQLIDNINMFLSKKCIYTFGGYAIAQLRRAENAIYHNDYPIEESLKHVKETIDFVISKLKVSNEITSEDLIEIEATEKDLLMTIDIKNKPLAKVRAVINDLLQVEHSYNRLNSRNKKKGINKLDKHIMHLIRLYLTVFDILEKQEVHTYREYDKDFLLEVRKGKFIKDNKFTDDFHPFLKTLQDRLDQDKLTTTLPNEPNYKEIEKFVVDVNTKVITDTVIKYKEPIKWVNLY